MKSHTKKTVLFILNYNGTKMTRDLLASLAKIKFMYPVWVVDNGSTVDDSELFHAAYPGVEVKRIEDNCGFAGGVNEAMRLAAEEGFDYAYEMNNDTLATDDFLSPCVEIMDKCPDVDIVGSRVRSLNPATGEFSIWGYLSNPSELKKFSNGFLETRHVLGCGMLMRVKTFLEFGGLDERFFCYCEENDYCFRIAKAGKRQGIAAKSLILHQGSMTTGGIWFRYWEARNTILFSRLHDSSWMNSGSYLVKKSLYSGFVNLFHGRFDKTAAAGHGYCDAFFGRFGKRTKPFNGVKGTMLFLVFAPIVLIYGISKSCFAHPFRPKPLP